MNNYITKIAFVALALNSVSCQSDIPDLQSDIAQNQATGIMSRSSSENYFPDGWQYLESGEEMITALQLSDSLLKSLSTEELVEVCMSYPLALDCFAFNDINIGVQRVISNFNGFAELKTRNDALDKVLDFYGRKLDEIEFLGTSVGYYINPLEYSFYERFITSGLFSDDSLINSQKLNLLVSKATDIHNQFKQLQGHIATESFKSLQSLMGSNKPMRKPASITYKTIYTPKGLPVETMIITCQDPEAERIAGINYIKKSKPNAVILDDATCTYNCHAYAWYMTEGGEKCWINNTLIDGTENVSNFFTDGTYEVTTENKATKVFYLSDDHSAVVAFDDTYISKWGALPLVSHKRHYSLYNSGNVKFYRKTLGTVFLKGSVDWDKSPDPTPINSYEDFSIDENYDTTKFRVEVFVSNTKEPTEPLKDSSMAYIVTSTKNTAKAYFAKYGTYHVCFLVYNKTTGKLVGEFLSSEIYVIP